MSATETSLEIITDIVTAAAALAGVGIGLYTFWRTSHENKELKRKEVLADLVLPLFNEFNTSPTMKVAKDILDDKPMKLIRSSDKYPIGEIGYDQLDITLRYVPPGSISDFTPEEMEVRDSFQAFLYLLCKLDYLVAQKIMKAKEIGKADDTLLFRYYIDRAAGKKVIQDVVRKYEYPLYGCLHKELDCRAHNK